MPNLRLKTIVPLLVSISLLAFLTATFTMLRQASSVNDRSWWPEPTTASNDQRTMEETETVEHPIETGETLARLCVSDLAANASSVHLYDKFELTFTVNNSVATNPQFPYDPATPPGLQERCGISVEGLFLPPGEDDWQHAIRQPGFLYQNYDRRQIDQSEWLYPVGEPLWKVRFAPKRQGVWKYMVRVQTASICPEGSVPCLNWIETDPASFTVTEAKPGNHGFVEVSKTDTRYFAYSDGEPFVGLGLNVGFSNTNFTYDADEQIERYAANGIDFVRTWMSGSAIAGSAWSPWAWFEGPGYGGYLPDPGLGIAPSGSGHDFAFHLSQELNRLCLFNGFTQGQIAVKPSSTYRLSVTLMARDISGPRDHNKPDFGFTIKSGGWPKSFPDDLHDCPNLISHMRNTEWTTVDSTITTSPSQWFLDYLYLLLDNTLTGEVYVSQVSLREKLPNGGLGPEILVKSSGDAHNDFNPLRSWGWDYLLDQAANKGVHLKVVVLEKNDRVWNLLGADGNPVESGDNNNFYASPNTKVRRLHEYFWRYLAARWGYSTAIHSWELLNEGDPFNSQHYEMANSFARYMHDNEPSGHLVSTSFWHSFPAAQFWGNADYPDIDYADIHAYISTERSAYEWSPPSGTALDTDSANTYRGSRGAIRVPAGVTAKSPSIWVRGSGSWRISVMVRAQEIEGTCPYGAPSSLAGPQLMVVFDGSGNTIMPCDPAKPDQYWICTSPAGTYDYTRLERVVTIPDDDWHLMHVEFKNDFAISGTAWYDNLSIESPDGRTVRLLGDGTFDDRERMDHDTALLNESIGLRYGALSPSGSGKPVVRGEAGIDHAENSQGELPELAKDVKGVWLHNFLWGTLNPGGVYELYWWTGNIERNDLYFQFKALRDFMDNIPLHNGHYQNAEAHASEPTVRVVGQSDRLNGRAHLWIQNKNHSWWNVVNGAPWGQLGGTVTMPGLIPNQKYPIELWQFDDHGNLTVREDTLRTDAAGSIVLDLSSLPPSVTDIAVKIGSYDKPQAQITDSKGRVAAIANGGTE